MSKIRLQDKIAMVVGAGSRGEPAGTGYAAAKLFAQHSASVLVVDNDRPRAEVTEREILDEGGIASVFEADVTTEAACRAMVEACRERYGGLHVVFNNVATYGTGAVTEIDEEELDRVFEINLKSMMLTCKHAVPLMKASGGGSIINIASIDGLRAGWVRNVPYAVTKAGAAQLTRVMAVHHGRDNIRSNRIAPGQIMAPLYVISMKIDAHYDGTWDHWEAKAPLGMSLGRAVFLASDESRWISGVVLPVDAGLLAATPLAVYDNISLDRFSRYCKHSCTGPPERHT